MLHTTRKTLERVQCDHDALATAYADHRRFAHLLLDSLCQELVGISLECEILKHRLERNASAAAPGVTAISRSILRAMDYARDIAQELDPVSERPDGLAPSLYDFARKVSDRRRTRCLFDRRGLLVLVHDPTVATSLYRIAEQLVGEADKRQYSRRLSLRLTLKDAVLKLCIKGDGKGRRAGAPTIPHKSRALLSQRADCIGATLRFDQHPLHGFTMTCSLPHRRGTAILAELRKVP